MAMVQNNTFMYCVEPNCQDPCLLSQKHPIRLSIENNVQTDLHDLSYSNMYHMTPTLVATHGCKTIRVGE